MPQEQSRWFKTNLMWTEAKVVLFDPGSLQWEGDVRLWLSTGQNGSHFNSTVNLSRAEVMLPPFASLLGQFDVELVHRDDGLPPH